MIELRSVIDTIRPFAEVLFFLTAGPVLSFVAFLALKQIKVARDSAEIDARRDSIRLAAQCIDHYLDRIVPLIDHADQLINDHKLELYTRSTFTDTDEEIKCELFVENDSSKKLIPFAGDLLKPVNQLETFAVFFTSRVADKSVAYSSVGRSFVECAKRHLPLMQLFAERGHFTQTRLLLNRWHALMKADDRKIQLELLKDKKRPPPLPPIGVRSDKARGSVG